MKNNRSVIDDLQTVVFSYLTHEQKMLLGPYFYDAVSKHKHEIMKVASIERVMKKRVYTNKTAFNKMAMQIHRAL
jgi:hypothetical protein